MMEIKISTGETNYNTNLASEYFIMSILCRTAKDAYLSLGNKKGVDIIVKTKLGAMCIVEVKGVNKRNDWLISNSGKFETAPNLIYAQVCYHGKIDDLNTVPDFWFVPSLKLSGNTEHKISKNGKTVYISNKYIRENYDEYKNSTKYLEEYLNAF